MAAAVVLGKHINQDLRHRGQTDTSQIAHSMMDQHFEWALYLQTFPVLLSLLLLHISGVVEPRNMVQPNYQRVDLLRQKYVRGILMCCLICEMLLGFLIGRNNALLQTILGMFIYTFSSSAYLLSLLSSIGVVAGRAAIKAIRLMWMRMWSERVTSRQIVCRTGISTGVFDNIQEKWTTSRNLPGKAFCSVGCNSIAIIQPSSATFQWNPRLRPSLWNTKAAIEVSPIQPELLFCFAEYNARYKELALAHSTLMLTAALDMGKAAFYTTSTPPNPIFPEAPLAMKPCLGCGVLYGINKRVCDTASCKKAPMMTPTQFKATLVEEPPASSANARQSKAVNETCRFFSVLFEKNEFGGIVGCRMQQVESRDAEKKGYFRPPSELGESVVVYLPGLGHNPAGRPVLEQHLMPMMHSQFRVGEKDERVFIFLGADGGEAPLLMTMQEDDPDKYGYFIVIPAGLHFIIRIVFLFICLTWHPVGKHLAQAQGFNTPSAQDLIRKVKDLHKAMQFLFVLMESVCACIASLFLYSPLTCVCADSRPCEQRCKTGAYFFTWLQSSMVTSSPSLHFLVQCFFFYVPSVDWYRLAGKYENAFDQQLVVRLLHRFLCGRGLSVYDQLTAKQQRTLVLARARDNELAAAYEAATTTRPTGANCAQFVDAIMEEWHKPVLDEAGKTPGAAQWVAGPGYAHYFANTRANLGSLLGVERRKGVYSAPSNKLLVSACVWRLKQLKFPDLELLRQPHFVAVDGKLPLRASVLELFSESGRPAQYSLQMATSVAKWQKPDRQTWQMFWTSDAEFEEVAAKKRRRTPATRTPATSVQEALATGSCAMSSTGGPMVAIVAVELSVSPPPSGPPIAETIDTVTDIIAPYTDDMEETVELFMDAYGQYDDEASSDDDEAHE